MLTNASNRDDHDARTRHIGFDLLGPVVHRWLLGLHQYMRYLDDGDTVFLGCARAGLRIQRLYDLFLKGMPDAQGAPIGMFWISRLAVCKGTYERNAKASQQIAREYWHEPMHHVIRGIFRHQPELLGKLDLSRSEHQAHGRVFPGWIDGPTAEARAMRQYLKKSSTAFDAYLRGMLEGKKQAVLIDSGWQGSAQSLLTSAYPDTRWKGLYFGRILTPTHDRDILQDVVGLLFERDAYDPALPESAFVRHRHLIETLLEPNGPSIEEVPSGPAAKQAQAMIDANLGEQPDRERDALYLHVVDYLHEHAEAATPSSIFARHQKAMRELERLIVAPTRAEAQALVGKQRSADFGKELDVPVLTDPTVLDPADSNQRIAAALWTEGQIALEYEGGIARDLQKRCLGQSGHPSYFDPAAASKWPYPAVAPARKEPRVAVITRTKNRPVLLQRAAASVAAQNYPNLDWVIVNDGGDEDAVRQVIDDCVVDRRSITLVGNDRSLGMEAASNAGIRASESDYVVIHDDDDSWSPTYLKEMTALLESAAGKRYGGAISGSIYVSEEIRGDSVVEHERWPYMDWVRNVQFAEMVCGNLFPPIAFLFRRSMWDLIGGYNEELPVLGDWFFNLEFLLHRDIAVLPGALAHYHHRDRGNSLPAGTYANSVIGGRSKHEEFAAVARNAFLRKHVEDNPSAVAVLLGYMVGDLRHRMPGKRNDAETGTGNGKADLDLADRYWVVANVNKLVAERSKRGFLRRAPKPLEPQASWLEISEYVRLAKLEIPVPDNFDDERYLSQNEDVARVLRSGGLKSGFQHYVMHGRHELRERPARK